MKAFAVILVTLGLLAAANAIASGKDLAAERRAAILNSLTFEQYMVHFSRNYSSADETEYRRQVFHANVAKIATQNKMSQLATFAINKFADLTEEEFRHFYRSPVALPQVRDDGLPVHPEFPEYILKDLPTSYDWRQTKNVVTPVKDQGQCGSCWTFSTTGAVEGANGIKTGNLISLSEQALVDCDKDCDAQNECDQGCNGGLMRTALGWVVKNGLPTEDAYPYQGVDGTCQYNPSQAAVHIKNFTAISTNEDQIAAALVAMGPLSMGADATEWQFYMGGGVFDLPCGHTLDHGILIVGYGTKGTIFGTKKYWIVKNSWGDGWGDQGYILLARGDCKCGMCNYVTAANA
jgi:cathepsin F